MRLDGPDDSWETDDSPLAEVVDISPLLPDFDDLERTTVATFRAFCLGMTGPDRTGVYRMTFGTDEAHKRPMFDVTDHAHEFFEVEVRTVRSKEIPDGTE